MGVVDPQSGGMFGADDEVVLARFRSENASRPAHQEFVRFDLAARDGTVGAKIEAHFRVDAFENALIVANRAVSVA